MESKTNYTIVGLTVLILGACLLSFGLWLSIGFDRKQYNLYTVYVNEAVSGLSDDAVVKYNGVKVGYVNKIDINEFDPQLVKIQLKIEEGTPITNSTQATLINQGITGAVYLGLSPSSPSPFPLQKTPGEPYPVIPYKPSFLSQLERNINELSNSVKRVFDKQNARALKQSLENLQVITGAIAKDTDSIHKTLVELPLLIADIKNNVIKFGNMSGHMSNASEQVTRTMKAGRLTIDKITQQTIPPVVILIQRLDQIAANLEKVSAQMRQNPSIIIRGTAPQKAGPGE